MSNIMAKQGLHSHEVWFRSPPAFRKYINNNVQPLSDHLSAVYLDVTGQEDSAGDLDVVTQDYRPPDRTLP